MISCILLSAGLSRRFGSPKALAKIRDEMVIERLQNMLIQTQVDEIIVVLGAFADQIKPYLLNHKKVKVVYNKDYNLGQTSSFQAGLKAVSPDCAAVMLLPVDYPFLRASTIDQLIDHFRSKKPKILIPAHAGHKGHPPLFSIDLKDEFLSLDVNTGLNTIAHDHAAETAVISPDDHGITATFNTPEELDRIIQEER